MNSFTQTIRAGVFALAVLLIASVARADTSSETPPPAASTPPSTAEPPARDWQALAAQTNQTLAAALDDASRGRPADARFRAAVKGYADLLIHAPLSDNDRARVLYNRGLAELALGDPAAAVYDLRRSDSLAPGYAQTTRELDNARDKLKALESPSSATPSAPAAPPAPVSAGSTPESVATVAWNAVRRLHPALRWTTGLGAFVAAWLLLVPLLLTSSRPVRRWLGVASVFTLAVALLSIGSLVAEGRWRPRLPDVVVISNQCTPRQGPDLVAYPATAFDGRATIPRGTELRTLDVRTLPENPAVIAWVRVRDRSAAKDGPSVWVRSADVGWVSPPPAAPAPRAVRASSPTPAAQTPRHGPATPPRPALPDAKPAAPAADAATRT